MRPDQSHAVQLLPSAPTPFIGRGEELAEITRLLDTTRLCTLSGSGGSGKTRLAIEVARELPARFPHSVYWVDLSALTIAALLPLHVASSCGIVDRSGGPILDMLVSSFQEGPCLLLLDNCEHLLAACAQLVVTLIEQCAELRILTTSREPLATPGELVWLVKPLAVPDDSVPLTVAHVQTYAAVQLFVSRATAVVPDFVLNDNNGAAVARICQQVDGLPLAIELAAARLRVLSLAEIALRLGDAMRLLTAGNVGAPTRQQTLRATLDWSYDLLNAAEQAVFCRLAVFVGGFSLAAAEAVCADTNIAEAHVLDLLTQLIEKSLVQVQTREPEARYRLLEPLRQYAEEKLRETSDLRHQTSAGQAFLATKRTKNTNPLGYRCSPHPITQSPSHPVTPLQRGTLLETQRKHRDWYLALATQAEGAAVGPEQGRWLDRLAREHDNLRVALGWSLTQTEVAAAAQIVSGIWAFWLQRGHLREGRRWTEEILAALPEPTSTRAHMLWVGGLMTRPDAAKGLAMLSESLALWEQLGDAQGTARALASLGFLAQAIGDHRQATIYLERSLPLAKVAGDVPTLSRALSGLAVSHIEAGDFERAAAVCEEGLTLHQRTGDRRGAAAALANLGLIWRERGDDGRAAARWEESLAIRRSIGDLGGVAHMLTLLGALALRASSHARAAALYREALELRQRAGELDGMPLIFVGYTALALVSGALTTAVQLAAAAQSLYAATRTKPSAYERNAHAHTLAELRARLDPASFERAWVAGQLLGADEAVALALSMPVPPDGTPTGQNYGLTPREIDVLRQLTLGLTYAEIGEKLVISPRTVDAHVRAIFGKLAVNSRSAATRVAVEQRLV